MVDTDPWPGSFRESVTVADRLDPRLRTEEADEPRGGIGVGGDDPERLLGDSSAVIDCEEAAGLAHSPAANSSNAVSWST